MKKLISIIFILLFVSFSSAYAENNKPQAMIVFDASGSMWGQINGKAKITIAKKALNKVVNNWDDNIHLGLIAYGHRKKGDCNDIQVLSPIAQVNKNSMIAKVKAIKPKGKTPISRSIKKAAEALKYTEEKATVILISDGKETCDADPCGVAKSLEKDGIDFVAHVIGFDVDKQTDAQLKCIADSTGGEYFSAKNASSLNNAMSKIIEKVKEPEPPKAPVVKELKTNLKISATETEGGKWVEATHWIYKVVDGEKEDSSLTSCRSNKKETCQLKIPAGTYTIESGYNQYIQWTPLEVSATELNKLNIVMGQTGKTELAATENEGGKWVEATHWIYKMVDGEKEDSSLISCRSDKNEACQLQLPVGTYKVESRYNQFTQWTPLEIKATELNKLNIVMGQTGKTELVATESEGGKWVEATHWIYKVVDGEKEGSSITNCRSNKKKACQLKIPVGTYTIETRYSKKIVWTPFELTAEGPFKINVLMGQTGKAELTATETEGGKWVKARHWIYKVVDGEKEGSYITACTSTKQKACEFQLPTGSYTVETIYSKKTQLTPFELPAGPFKLNVVLGQTGKAELTATETEGGKWVKARHWIYKVVDGEKEGSYITACTSTKKKACEFQIPTGSYTVETIYSKKTQLTPFELSAGPFKLNVVLGQTGQTELTATEKEGGKWVEVRHWIYKRVDGEKEGSYVLACTSTKKKACNFQLPVGEYIIESIYEKTKKQTPFEISSGQSKLNLVMGETAQIEITTAEKSGGKWIKARHWIYKTADGEKEGSYIVACTSTAKAPCKTKLALGSYGIETINDKDKKWTTFELSDTKKTPLQIVFGKFILGANCPDTDQNISYEIYISSGRMVFEKQAKCSEKIPATIDNGDYTVEAKTGDIAKEVKFTVGGDNPSQLIIDMRESEEPAHKDLIQADSPAPQEVEAKKEIETPAAESKSDTTDSKTGQNEVIQAFKNSITTTLPSLNKVNECYQQANDLSEAKTCETMEKATLKIALEAMGESGDNVKITTHTEWNDETKKVTVNKITQDIKDMKLSIICIDEGSSFFNIEACVKDKSATN